MTLLARGDRVELLNPKARSDLRVMFGLRDGAFDGCPWVTVGAFDDDGWAEGEVEAEGDGVTVGRFEVAVVPATLLPLRPWTAYQPPAASTAMSATSTGTSRRRRRRLGFGAVSSGSATGGAGGGTRVSSGRASVCVVKPAPTGAMNADCTSLKDISNGSTCRPNARLSRAAGKLKVTSWTWRSSCRTVTRTGMLSRVGGCGRRL